MGTNRRLRFALLFGIVGIAGCPAANPPSPANLYIDFRGRPVPSESVTFGPMTAENLRAEPEGVRITQPADHIDKAVGLDLRTKVHGDFEVTATMAILEAERPDIIHASKVGVFLTVNQAARVGRLLHMDNPQMVWERFTEPDGTRSYTGSGEPSREDCRRLRLKRTGRVMHFLWSPAAEGNDFREVGDCEFGDGDITQVRLRIEKGERVGLLDVRFADLRIAGPRVALGRRPWVTPAIGAAVAVIVLAILLAIRRRARKIQAA